VCSDRLIIAFQPSCDLLTTTTSRDSIFSPLVAITQWSVLGAGPSLATFPYFVLYLSISIVLLTA